MAPLGERLAFALADFSASGTTAAYVGDENDSYEHPGIHLIVNRSNAGAGIITPKVQGKSPAGDWYDLLVGIPISSAGISVLKLGPGMYPVPNAIAADYLPVYWRAAVDVANASLVKYTLTANLLG